MIAHPGYNDNTLEDDIALIKTKTPFEWTEAVKPVCLPAQNTRPDDRINRETFPKTNDEQSNDPVCAVSGYGTTGTNSDDTIHDSYLMTQFQAKTIQMKIKIDFCI